MFSRLYRLFNQRGFAGMKRFGIFIICVLATIAFSACTPTGNQPGASADPAITTQLPDGVYKAQITIMSAPQTLRAGEQASVKVKVKNLGNANWPSRGQGAKYKFDLGNHWLDKKGAEVTGDDGRASLPHDLKPGDETELVLNVRAPKTPGDYILVLDMVHEDVTWFALRGSETAKTNVTVQ